MTAEEFIKDEYDRPDGELAAINCEGHHVQFMMVEFAKYHVKQALESVKDKSLNGNSEGYILISKEILDKCYPKDNIK